MKAKIKVLQLMKLINPPTIDSVTDSVKAVINKMSSEIASAEIPCMIHDVQTATRASDVTSLCRKVQV